MLTTTGAGTYDSSGMQIAYAIIALLAAYSCDAFYIVGLQLLQNGGFVTLRSQRLNPITTMRHHPESLYS
jgi:hypothetical protein